MPWNNAAMLTDKDGNFIPQLWDPSQNKFIPWDGKVQQSGSIVEEVVLVNAMAITDTGNKFSSFVDVSRFREIDVLVENSLTKAGSPISIRLFLYDGATTSNGIIRIKEGTEWKRFGGTEGLEINSIIPSQLGRHSVASDLPIIRDWKFSRIAVGLWAFDVPDSGSVTVTIKGVVN